MTVTKLCARSIRVRYSWHIIFLWQWFNTNGNDFMSKMVFTTLGHLFHTHSVSPWWILRKWRNASEPKWPLSWTFPCDVLSSSSFPLKTGSSPFLETPRVVGLSWSYVCTPPCPCEMRHECPIAFFPSSSSSPSVLHVGTGWGGVQRMTVLLLWGIIAHNFLSIVRDPNPQGFHNIKYFSCQ